MQTTLQDIAEEFGVSAATVSYALSGKGRVSPDLAERIRAKADALGYAPSAPGRALRTGRSGVLGLVLPDISNPLFPKIAQSVEAAAAREGYGVLIADSRGDVGAQTEALQRLVQRGADGVVVVPRRGTRIGALDLPVAVIDTPSTPGNACASDHRGGGRLLAEHIRALGHHRVALIGESRDSLVQQDRIGGMRAGLGPDCEITEIWLEESPAPDFPALAASGVTAFLAVSDLLALRVLTALQRAGLDVPGRASVAGFDDLIFSAAVTPALTTIAQDTDRVASGAVAALIARIQGRDPPPEQVVPTHLVARASTGPAPANEDNDNRQGEIA